MDKKTKIHLALSPSGNKLNIPTDLPVIFTAGPIRNAPKWQQEAVRLFLERNQEVFIATPIREVADDLKPFVERDWDGYEQFQRQRAWEQHYLYAAAKKGCIIFWLPKESETKEVQDKVYAHITMLELGEWIVRKKNDPSINLVIGTDGNFPEWPTIMFELVTEIPSVHICMSLEDTVDKALMLCGENNAH